MIEKHEVMSVAPSSITVDGVIWSAVRMVIGIAGEGPAPAEEVVFPVAKRNGELVLLARFELFVDLRQAGVPSVRVYRVDWDGVDPLVEYAIALSMPTS